MAVQPIETNGTGDLSVTMAIIPPSILDVLRHTPAGYARLCAACRSYLPPTNGQPLRWRTDGLCLRCLLRTLAASHGRLRQQLQGASMSRGSLAYVPDQLADDTSIPLRVRVLIELQRRGAAVNWTRPISTTELADQFQRSRAAVARAISWAVNQQYLERQRASLPRGGRGARYRICLEQTQEAGQKAGQQ